MITVVTPADRVIARQMWTVAVGLVETRTGIREARDALADPCPSTIRALLAAGRGERWLPSVLDALAEVGIAASEDVLGDAGE